MFRGIRRLSLRSQPLVRTSMLPVRQVGRGAHRRQPFDCRLLCLCGEMVVHTLFEIYFKLGLHFKDMSPRGVEGAIRLNTGLAKQESKPVCLDL